MNDKQQTTRRNTHQKQMILDTLVKLGSHVSAGEIYKELEKNSSGASRATVFRVLSDMADDGILLKIGTTNGDFKYDITNYPHYHIVCRSCGSVADIDFEEGINILSKVKSSSGYTVEDILIEAHGLCPECAEKENNN